MLNFCRKHNGEIAVFMTLILIPTFFFAGLMFDGSRILASKNLVSGAGDLAMNAALSNYNEDLNTMYGLLAMAETPEEVEDILQEYFEASLNANGISNDDFSKALVYLELTEGGFKASEVVDTEIFRTEVFKQEVLEYMKYRAPIKLYERVKERFADAGDIVKGMKTLSEKKEAAKAELKYKKKLNDIQKKINKLDELNDKQIEYVKKIKTKAELDKMLEKTKKDAEQVSLLSVIYNRLLESDPDGSCPSSGIEHVEAMINQGGTVNTDPEKMTASEGALLIKVRRMKSNAAGNMPWGILDDLDKNAEDYEDQRAKYEHLIDVYNGIVENMEDNIVNLGEAINDEHFGMVTPNVKVVHDQWECAHDGAENALDIEKQIEVLKEALENSKSEYEAWKTAVNNLSDPKEKEEYQKVIDKCSGFYEKGGLLGDYTEKIGKNKEYFEIVRDDLADMQFCDKTYINLTPSDVLGRAVASGQITSAGEITQSQKNAFVTYIAKDSIDLPNEIQKVDTSDPFVNLMKTEWCDNKDADKSAGEAASKEWDDELKKKAKDLEQLLTSDDLPEGDIPGVGNLPSDWLNQSKEGSYTPSSVSTSGGIGDEDSREEATDAGISNLGDDDATSGMITEVTGFGDTIANGFNGLLDKMYYTEYGMDMFSYYTVDKSTEGKEITDPKSLSRQPLKEDEVYRAEVEYILWGSNNIRSNVNKTKAIIFAIRYVTNLAFAFTNGTLRAEAMKIAMLFPVGAFGKMVIQSALLVIVATIETTEDMLDLCGRSEGRGGKKVPFLKDESTWHTWIPFKIKIIKADKGLTYEDYVWIFLAINMIASEDTKMARTADMIELNMTDGKSNEDNTLKDMFTMVSTDAECDISTFFIQRFDAFYGQSLYGDGYKVKYHGIQGY